MVTPVPDFAHLLRMTDRLGTFEHALLAEPRREHGYCTDDMARVLVVTSREVAPSAEVRALRDLSLRFLMSARGFDGAYRNRLDQRGRWLDRPSVEDCWGRSIWGLGTAAARGSSERVRQIATSELERAAVRRSPSPRATALACLGAVEVLAARPDNRAAIDLLRAAALQLSGMADVGDGWPWPEPRLAYANAVLPEALLAIGTALERPELVARGLDQLGWLLERQTVDGHLSVTPVGGAGPGDRAPGFDQQPIEVASLADACARAATVDDDPRWPAGVAAAVAWFLGDNDAGHVMWDAETGGGYDGLEADGPNRNQGTESTLALLSTLQHGRVFVPVPA